MKACPDLAKAFIDAFSGTISRCLIGTSAFVGGCMFGTFPEMQFANVLPFFFLPTIYFFVMTPLGLVAFISAWVCYVWFIRYDGGKWVLLTLFSAPTYGAGVWTLMLRQAGPFGEGQTWEAIWRDFHWPIVVPLIATMLVATPDCIHLYLRITRRK